MSSPVQRNKILDDPPPFGHSSLVLCLGMAMPPNFRPFAGNLPKPEWPARKFAEDAIPDQGHDVGSTLNRFVGGV